MTPIQLDPNHSSNSFADTTLAQAQANARFALNAQMNAVNAARIADYDTQWKSYVEQRNDRPNATNIVEPLPAQAEAVFIDGRGWPYIDSAPVLVTPVRVYALPVKTPAASIFGTASILGSADALLAGAQLYKPFTYGGMTFQRLG